MIASELWSPLKRGKRPQLTEVEAKTILSEADIPAVQTKIARSKKRSFL